MRKLLLVALPLAVASCGAPPPPQPPPPPAMLVQAAPPCPAPPTVPDEPSPTPLVTAAPPSAEAATYSPSADQATAQRLAGSIVVGGHAYDYLRDLADKVGPRMTGSPGYAAAAAWAAESFKRAGVDRVAFEQVTMPAGWERRDATARVTTPIDRALHVLPGPWSPPTPPAGITAEVALLPDASPAYIRAHADALRGKIALANRASFEKKGEYSWSLAVEAPGELKKAGAVALFMESGREGGVLGITMPSSLHVLVSALPRAIVGHEDAKLIARALEAGPVTVTYSNPSPVTGPIQVPNVVAEIRGREAPDEWVLVGAHLDSWDLGTGAQDNGSGVAQVLEAARAIHALGTPPRRSIRFALYAGEEQGCWGSMGYASGHARELDRAVLVLNTDHGAGAPRGWGVNGREDVKRALSPLAASLLASLGGDEVTAKMDCDTDDCSFLVHGVPTANLETDGSKYFDVHHLTGDTLDKVKRASLEAGAAVVAVTAYAVADAPQRLAPRASRATVAALAEKGKIMEDLVGSGMWP